MHLAQTAAGAILTDRDKDLIEYILNEGRGCVLVLNKWDLLPEVYQQEQVLTGVLSQLRQLLRDVGMVPIISMSGLHGDGVDALLPTTLEIFKKWDRHLKTNRLNQWLREYQRLYDPPRAKGRALTIKYVVQHGR